MDAADAPRRSDLDGRGNLSLSALEEFVTWFCAVALDQLTFMSQLFDLDNLSSRLDAHVMRDWGLPESAAKLARAVLQRGELPRGEASAVLGIPERTARDIVSRLTQRGLIASDTPKGPLHLRFTTSNADALFPRLFPAQQ